MHPFYAKYFRQKYFRNQIKNVARDRCGEEVAYPAVHTRVALHYSNTRQMAPPDIIHADLQNGISKTNNKAHDTLSRNRY